MSSFAQQNLKLPENIRACLFDMDGVLTQTAKVHSEAWKAMFDAFLKQRAEQDGSPFVPFNITTDYVKYVDGRLRQDGVRTFLQSRGIEIPEGNTDDDASVESIYGLGNRKNNQVVQLIQTEGVETFADAIAFLHAVRSAGIKTAVVSASKNTPEVLRVTNLTDQFDFVMHGGIAAEMHLPGKPAPDTFLAAAEALGEPAANCAVLEDAISGVQAGKAGSFGYVIGVDRVNHGEELKANGADIVLRNLEELVTQS